MNSIDKKAVVAFVRAAEELESAKEKLYYSEQGYKEATIVLTRAVFREGETSELEEMMVVSSGGSTYYVEIDFDGHHAHRSTRVNGIVDLDGPEPDAPGPLNPADAAPEARP
jgi:hypothetical protein